MDENNQREATALSSLQQLRKRISTGMDQVFESQRIITKMSLSFRSSRDFMLVDFGKLNFLNARKFARKMFFLQEKQFGSFWP
jgi:hypothetical protein